MTYKDVFTQILSEVSGASGDKLSNLLNAFLESHPGNHKFDEELPDKKAKELLESLRKEKSGIQAWLAKGFIELDKNQGHA